MSFLTCRCVLLVLLCQSLSHPGLASTLAPLSRGIGSPGGHSRPNDSKSAGSGRLETLDPLPAVDRSESFLKDKKARDRSLPDFRLPKSTFEPSEPKQASEDRPTKKPRRSRSHPKTLDGTKLPGSKFQPTIDDATFQGMPTRKRPDRQVDRQPRPTEPNVDASASFFPPKHDSTKEAHPPKEHRLTPPKTSSAAAVVPGRPVGERQTEPTPKPSRDQNGGKPGRAKAAGHNGVSLELLGPTADNPNPDKARTERRASKPASTTGRKHPPQPDLPGSRDDASTFAPPQPLPPSIRSNRPGEGRPDEAVSMPASGHAGAESRQRPTDELGRGKRDERISSRQKGHPESQSGVIGRHGRHGTQEAEVRSKLEETLAKRKLSFSQFTQGNQQPSDKREPGRSSLGFR